MTYAIIRLGGKQYRVSEGERLLVDRLSLDESATFSPEVLFVGGDGGGGGSVTVTARVLEHTLGPKIRIGKYRKRTGYRRHTGHRSRFSQIEIDSIGAAAKSGSSRSEKKDAPAKKAATEKTAAPTGLPSGYGEMTVAQVSANTKSWSSEELEAALAYEREHGARKGAIAALESAIGSEEG